MNVYTGHTANNEYTVFKNGQEMKVASSSQLAFALLLDHFSDQRKAEKHFTQFKNNMIARFNNEQGWRLTSQQIDQELQELEIDYH